MAKKIFRPFETLQELQLLTVGGLLLVIFSFLAYYLNARFAGLLSISFVEEVRLHQPLLDALLNTLTLTLCMYGLAYFVNSKTRFIDLLATALIAQIPFYPLILFNIKSYSLYLYSYIIENIQNPYAFLDLPTFYIVLYVSQIIYALIALVLFCILLYQGFKIATNAKKVAQNLLLIPAVIIAVIITKLLITLY